MPSPLWLSLLVFTYFIHFITMAMQMQLTDIVESDWKKSLKLIQIPLWLSLLGLLCINI